MKSKNEHEPSSQAIILALMLTTLFVAVLVAALALWIGSSIFGLSRFEGAVIVLLSLITARQLIDPLQKKVIAYRSE